MSTDNTVRIIANDNEELAFYDSRVLHLLELSPIHEFEIEYLIKQAGVALYIFESMVWLLLLQNLYIIDQDHPVQMVRSVHFIFCFFMCFKLKII